MGNILGTKRTAKVMKITGESLVFKTPIQAENILKNHPRHVLFESEEVKLLGTRAQPLELQQNLEPERLYFLVDIPENCCYSKRVVESASTGSAVSSAAGLLESLKQCRRSSCEEGLEDGVWRVRIRVPKVEVEKLMRESKDEEEMAERLLGLFVAAEGDATAVCAEWPHATAPTGAGAIDPVYI